MKHLINKVFKRGPKVQKKPISREQMGKKVEAGTEKAIKEYGYVFRKLAEYDRS